MDTSLQRKSVLLLFGGESSEHDVSISSARNVYAAIDDEKYEVQLCYIDKTGKWWLIENLAQQIDTHGAPQLLPALGAQGFITLPDQLVIQPDVMLPILHGINGEDGSVQGLAQLLHIPIVGCGIAASSIGLNKVLAKQFLDSHHIPIVPYKVHHRLEPMPEFHKLSMTLGSPIFVKPAHGGSSVGVSKVYNEEELADAIELAYVHDDVILLEQAISGRELEVAVIGSVPNHRVSVVGEVITDAEFYSYDDKYTNGTSSVAIPADISQKTMSRIQAVAGRVYEVLGCKGLSRVDFFLTDDDVLYLNEVNTFPGFTNISMYPKLWKYEGVSYAEVIELLINDALEHGTIELEEMEE